MGFTKKNAQYLKCFLSEWLNGRISYESNSIQFALFQLHLLHYSMLCSGASLTTKMAIRSKKGITDAKLQYLNKNEYINIKNDVIFIEATQDNYDIQQSRSVTYSNNAKSKGKKALKFDETEEEDVW